jgi:hypothetical protein
MNENLDPTNQAIIRKSLILSEALVFDDFAGQDQVLEN